MTTPPGSPSTRRPILALLFAVAATACLSSCRSFRAINPWAEVPGHISAKRVPAAIEQAEKLFAEGRTEVALEWMRTARLTRSLSTDVRNQVQATLEKIAERRVEELSEPDSPPSKLVAMLDLDLPRQIAVTAGIRGARRYLEQGRAYKSFHVLEKVDKKYPTHHERAAAAAVCADAGFHLAERPGRFLGIWKRWSRPTEVLEYLVMNYPLEPRCDLAYAKLAELYERRELYDLAIDRHEDLQLYHPGSPLVPYSAAAIPHLRLVRIESPEYSRAGLATARAELEDWLKRNNGRPDLVELEGQVRTDLNDCLRRLAESDLGIAGFYRRVGNDVGMRRHAERALDEARLAEDAERADRALAMIASRPGPSLPLPDETEEQPAAPPPEDTQR